MAANHCSSLGGLSGNSLEGFAERLHYSAKLLCISPRTFLPSGQTGSALLPDHLGGRTSQAPSFCKPVPGGKTHAPRKGKKHSCSA